MNDLTQHQVVRSYLRELNAALTGLPEAERRAIIDGATEELSGLDAVAATAHIEKLGDPEFIAAAARAESRTDPADPVVASGRDPRWYIVVASLLVAFGGIVIPVLGWVVGIVMVWMSSTWRTWQKWVGTLTAPVLIVLSVFILYLWFASPRAATSGEGHVPNPLIPQLYDVVWSSVLFFVAVNVVVGMWLLLRALRRVNAPLR